MVLSVWSLYPAPDNLQADAGTIPLTADPHLECFPYAQRYTTIDETKTVVELNVNTSSPTLQACGPALAPGLRSVAGLLLFDTDEPITARWVPLDNPTPSPNVRPLIAPAHLASCMVRRACM